MSSQPLWYVVTAKKNHGPYSGQQLLALAKEGKLQAGHKVSHESQTKGQPVLAGSIRQLQSVFNANAELPAVQDPPESHPEEAMIKAGKQALGSIAASVSSAANSLAAAVPKRAPQLVQPAESSLGDFVADGQDPKVVSKLLERVHGICTSSESPLYAAVQSRPVANFAPDAVVLTNKRFIVFHQKVLWRFEFRDYQWREVGDVHMREDMLAATISFQPAGSGKRVEVNWLPKSQAHKVYRIAQEQEELAYQHRRELMLEEKQAGAAQTVVNTAIQSPAPSPAASSDPVAKLTQLKQMLDAGLIEQSEFDAKKTELLSQM